MTIREFINRSTIALTLPSSEVAKIIEEDIKNHILSSKSIDGKPYPPLMPATIRLKSSRGQPLKPLIATGALLASIKVQNGSDYLNIIVDVDYASYLKDKYNYVGLSTDALKEIDELLQKRINRILESQ